MDMNELMKTMLSSESIKTMSQVTGTSQKDVKNVLAEALPSLLNGAKGQADDAGTVAGFAGALQDHAKADTTDIVSFLSGVDLEDGGKIVGHLLGTNAEATTKQAAAKAGLDAGSAGTILSAAAPLLMSLLGQQTGQAQAQQQLPTETAPASTAASGLSGLLGGLLSNVDLGGLLMNLLGSGK